jgi:hypothetical integral membrane protein (TIGR02206 family)
MNPPTLAEAGPAFLREFQSFTAFHLITALAFAGTIAGACVLGRRLQARGREYHLRVAWLLFMFGWQAWTVVYYLLPGEYDPAVSLPLHVCDLVPWIGMIALLTQHPLFRAVLFYWGIGLSTQAFFTPVLREGLAEWKYWLFWVGHTQIVGSAVYDLAVLRFRPDWKHLGLGIFFTASYAAFVSAINIPNGWNYGYIGDSRPEHPTIIDRLGDWPERVLWLALLVAGVFVVMTAAARGFAAWAARDTGQPSGR